METPTTSTNHVFVDVPVDVPVDVSVDVPATSANSTELKNIPLDIADVETKEAKEARFIKSQKAAAIMSDLQRLIDEDRRRYAVCITLKQFGLIMCMLITLIAIILGFVYTFKALEASDDVCLDNKHAKLFELQIDYRVALALNNQPEAASVLNEIADVKNIVCDKNNLYWIPIPFLVLFLSGYVFFTYAICWAP